MTKAEAWHTGYVPCKDFPPKKVSISETVEIRDETPRIENCYDDAKVFNQQPKNGYYMPNGFHTSASVASTLSEVSECEQCNACRGDNEGLDEASSELCLLQGKCNKHKQELELLVKANALSLKNGIVKSHGDGSDSYAKHNPLSNYQNFQRKRTPSGGSVIKQIQYALEKEEEEVKKACQACGCRWKLHIVMFTLLFANLLNYMDRYTIAGVLLQIQEFYGISNAEAGLLQTSFIVFYMLFSPLFGFLGDRWNRKYLMVVGIFFWALITLAGSFIPEDKFWLFLLMRAMVGIGEASYSTIAPTIIADLFVKDERSKALSVFYFAIPVGSGLGYIVGAKTAKLLGDWQWALRVTPPFGILCCVLILVFVDEPARGHAEGGSNLQHTSWGQDMKYLLKNKSFMLSTMGFTCVAFVAGALALWAPPYLDYSIRLNGYEMETSEVSLYFGIITCAAGFIGVGLGSETARRMRKINPRADPLVCAFGLIMCAPFLYAVLIISRYNVPATWVLVFVAEVFLCLNWAIVCDILMYIVIPTRRSTAEAVQILLSHALGDASSPYILGAVSDTLRAGDNSIFQNYLSLQNSLYMTCFVAVLGGAFFLANALFIEEDKAKADKVIKSALEMEITVTVSEIVQSQTV